MSRTTRSGLHGEELLDRFAAVRGLSGSEARVFEGKSDDFPDMGIVVRDEDQAGLAHGCVPSGSAGWFAKKWRFSSYTRVAQKFSPFRTACDTKGT